LSGLHSSTKTWRALPRRCVESGLIKRN